MSISKDGDVKVQKGTAQAFTDQGEGSTAKAKGDNSMADTRNCTSCTATASGTGSTATATNGSHNTATATATGTGSMAVAGHMECQIRERWDYHLTAEPGARQYSKDGYRQLNDAGLWEWHDLTEERGEL